MAIEFQKLRDEPPGAVGRRIDRYPRGGPCEDALRMRPDRIVVSETRDRAAALETLKSRNTGNPGGLSTIHANSADDVLRRVEDLIAEVSACVPRRAIGQAVDRVVHIRKAGTGRCGDAILGVDGHPEKASVKRPLG